MAAYFESEMNIRVKGVELTEKRVEISGGGRVPDTQYVINISVPRKDERMGRQRSI